MLKPSTDKNTEPGEKGDTALPVLGDSSSDSGREDEKRFLASLRRIIRLVGVYSRQLTQKHGITSPQLLCLHRLGENGPMPVKSLAKSIDIGPSTVVGIIDRLEARGYLRRERSGIDRRVVTVTITESGVGVLKSAPSPLQDALSHAMRSLPAEEASKLADSLEEIVDLMEAECVNAPSLKLHASGLAVKEEDHLLRDDISHFVTEKDRPE